MDGKLFCNTLEDKVADVNRNGEFDGLERKVPGKTAIPYGNLTRYSTDGRRNSGRNLPRLLNVTAFEGILIHPGNTAEGQRRLHPRGLEHREGQADPIKILLQHAELPHRGSAARRTHHHRNRLNTMSYEHYTVDPYVRAWNRIADGGEICSGGFDPKNDPDDRRKLLLPAGSPGICADVRRVQRMHPQGLHPVERTTTVTEFVRDTVVEVQLKAVHDTVTIATEGRDTASYLKNGTLQPRHWKDGKLGHSLGTLPDASVKGYDEGEAHHHPRQHPLPRARRGGEETHLVAASELE